MRAFSIITFPLLLLVGMFLALVTQHFLPPLPAGGARILLMPLVMFYGAVALPPWGMLLLVLTGGTMWDLLHAQTVDDTVTPLVGWSVVLYLILGTLMSGFRPWFQRGRWEVHCVVCGLCTAMIPLAEYLLLSLNRKPMHFEFNSTVWWRIAGTGLAAMFLAPFLFYGLNYLGYLLGYDPNPPSEEEP